MTPDEYELIDDEYVRNIPILLSKEIEKHIETNIVLFFKNIGYSIKKVPTTTTRTVDYEFEDLGIEVTSIQSYLPRNEDMNKLLSRHNESNSKICAYMYLKDDKPKVELLDEQQLDENVSIL